MELAKTLSDVCPLKPKRTSQEFPELFRCIIGNIVEGNKSETHNSDEPKLNEIGNDNCIRTKCKGSFEQILNVACKALRQKHNEKMRKTFETRRGYVLS